MTVENAAKPAAPMSPAFTPAARKSQFLIKQFFVSLT
jgi:hypothetical protein